MHPRDSNGGASAPPFSFHFEQMFNRRGRLDAATSGTTVGATLQRLNRPD
jgi:hypothetical protein